MVALNTVNLRPPMFRMSSSLLRVKVRYNTAANVNVLLTFGTEGPSPVSGSPWMT